MPASGGGKFPPMLQVEIGGGYRAGGPRLAARFRAHAFVPAGYKAGLFRRPGIHFHRRFRCKFHFVLCITSYDKTNYNHKTGAMSSRPPPQCVRSHHQLTGILNLAIGRFSLLKKQSKFLLIPSPGRPSRIRSLLPLRRPLRSQEPRRRYERISPRWRIWEFP